MVDTLLVDVDGDGSARVSVLRGGDLPAPVTGVVPKVEWPLDAAELEDLRWYLEQYLALPYAVYEERGARVAAGLGEWGRRVFECVFGAGPARDAYVELRGAGAPFEVVLRSPAVGALGLPWELMWDASRPVPMVLDGVRISRSLPTGATGRTFAVEGERLRVLMVISRPAGVADVAYQMIARPLVDRLSSVRGQVDLVVLRPPTLEALQAELVRAAETGAPYQVVHFDGHGSLGQEPGRVAGGGGMFADGTGVGSLVFEKAQGGAQAVDAGTVAQVLAAGRVPVVVLNACQSGAVGKELEAAVATRLLGQGARAVVAMAYSVYATAAAEFMTAFYERLFAGDVVSAAVAAGRERMARRNLRHSPKGMLELQDWVIPVHYMRSEVSFPQLTTTHQPAASIDALLDRVLQQPSDHEPGRDFLAATGEFVGRDDLFYQMETALQRRRAVVLHGPGGTGKTELAKAFGRWAAATGGVVDPGWVVWHSFEPGVATFGVDGVVNVIGGQLLGTRFHALTAQERLAVVTRVLAENRVLLVWDNFESVHSMPDPHEATPPLPQEEKERLADFLDQVTTGNGRSMVIVTSRTAEDWLPPGLVRLVVGGLGTEEAIEYANNLLAPLPVPAGHRATRDYADLLLWLDGHPLSMRLTLPHLTRHTPKQILEGLTGQDSDLFDGDIDLQAEVDGRTRSTSLTASITYSYRHLPQDVQHLMPAVAAFQGVVDQDVLGNFSSIPGVPARFAGTSAQEWAGALEQAAKVGLLTGLGAGMYHIHPALPGYLSAMWRSHTGTETDYRAERAAADTALLHAYAAFGDWLVHQIGSGEAALAFSLIGAQRATLHRLLTLALGTQEYSAAQAVLQALEAYGAARGSREEQDAWTDRVRLTTEAADGVPPALDTPAGALWLFAVAEQASRYQQARLLDRAERAYEDILAMLEQQPPTDALMLDVATAYHQLGMVAQHRGELGQAEDWYRKSLTIEEELANQPGMASSYHQLGMVAQHRGELDQAEDWYRKSLTIEEKLANQPGIASSYHQLGIVAQHRGELGQAEDWYRKSLSIKTQLRNRPGMISSYHQLGMVAQQRGELGLAEGWYRKALTIAEQLKDRPGMAGSYHQLGIVAQGRGELDQAENWYRMSLTISEELKYRPSMANTYTQLGFLAEATSDAWEALEWTVRAVATFEDFQNPATGLALARLVRMTASLGHPALARTWEQVTGQPLPENVGRFIADATEAAREQESKEDG
ncbi:CHAT domain-containing tetratricopeptide repeat protein [Ornithinimicrobium cerasi]|uniref:CHAT domain-containing tetratricopeptide repeat protein n=1 Tax=Ornithinimicrobium cerasi TaxID=2248773 RepID=UPI00137A8ACB|nr:tetratricopeptide repeat protein [Ornithinimicrobium cerasi]